MQPTMKINQMNLEQVREALRRAAKHGDTKSVHVRHLRERLAYFMRRAGHAEGALWARLVLFV
ncbi:MAG: hypothetical protein DDT21_02308 [Syntrophomonadaceae bacterium]|nr:hypothetical protein [Bacillota bacterium]